MNALSPDLQTQLLSLYQKTGNERVGFIVEDQVIEVDNIHPEGGNFFDVSLDDIEYYEEKSWGIWHTQPGKNSQLSYEDYSGFMNFPDHKHIVIGEDGLRVYSVKGMAIVKDYMALRPAA